MLFDKSKVAMIVLAATNKVINKWEAAKPSTPITIALQQGFNYKDKEAAGACRTEADFTSYFSQAKALAGTNGGFASARLYTAIECNTTATASGAFAAAVATNTSLLIGLDGSGGTTKIDQELTALTAAASKHGSELARLVVGISVGNEDIYRNAACNNCPAGASADSIVTMIKRTRTRLASTALSKTPIGHTDTGTAWVLSASTRVIAEADWIGHNSHPYWETGANNAITNAATLFKDALAKTEKVANGKAVWVTETGWPWRGEFAAKAIPSTTNAEKYWNDVGCSTLFGKRNVWWYQLADVDSLKGLAFTVIEKNATTPKFDLACS